MTAETDVDRFGGAALARSDDDPSFSDAALLTLVRSPAAGDPARQAAYDQLFRRHAAAARRLALSMLIAGRPSGAASFDDALEAAAEVLVADTFARVEDLVRSGQGPDGGFRPFLLGTMRKNRFDPDPAGDSLPARALAQLPERWRTVLWHVDVDGEDPATVAPLVGITPSGVTSLARRARERFRELYVAEHIADLAVEDDVDVEDCRRAMEHVARHHRLSTRDHSAASTHLRDCKRCQSLRAELLGDAIGDPADDTAPLRRVLAPLLLGSAAIGYLAAHPAAGYDAGRSGRADRRGSTGGSVARWRRSAASTVGHALEASVRGAAIAAGGITTIAVASLVVTTDMPDLVSGIASRPGVEAPAGAAEDDRDTDARPGKRPGASEAGGSSPSGERPRSPDATASGDTPGGGDPDSGGGMPAADVAIAVQGDMEQGNPTVLQISVTVPAEASPEEPLQVVLSVDGGLEQQGPADWSCTGSKSVTCVAGEVEPGATETAMIQVKLDKDAAGPVVATVSADGLGESTATTDTSVGEKGPDPGDGGGPGRGEDTTPAEPGTSEAGVGASAGTTGDTVDGSVADGDGRVTGDSIR